MTVILIMPGKLAIPGLRKINIFWKKCYDIIIFAPDFNHKILSCDSKNTVDVEIRPKFGNSIISIGKFISSILKWFDQNKQSFERWSWLKFKNLKMTQSMALKLYSSVAKELKLKVIF